MFKPVLALLLLLSFPAAAAVTAYSAVIEDLPLMQGMAEKTDDAVVFDKPDGRIVETAAEVAASAADVRNFYAKTLPPLGWRAAGDSFTRDRETLALAIENSGGHTIAHFTLTPNDPTPNEKGR